MFIPRGTPLHENLATSYVLVDQLVADLCEGGFSGAVEVMLRRVDAYIVIAGGRVAASLLARHGETTGALTDYSSAPVAQVAAVARQERGRISVYRYSAETAAAIAGRAAAEPLYTRLSTDFADLEKVITKLCRESDRQWFIEITLADGLASLVHINDDRCRVLTARDGLLREAQESRTPTENRALAALLDQSRHLGGVFDVYFRSADDAAAVADSAEDFSERSHPSAATDDVAEVVKEAKAVFQSLTLDDTSTPSLLPASPSPPPRTLAVPPEAASALRELTGSLAEPSGNGVVSDAAHAAAGENEPPSPAAANPVSQPTFFKAGDRVQMPPPGDGPDARHSTDDLLLKPDDLRATGLLKRGSRAESFAEIKRLMGEIVRTVEESVRAAGSRDSFAINLRAGQLKVADRYSFLDPFGGEFEYMAGEIVFVGDTSADDFVAGLSEALAQAIDSAARTSPQPDRVRLHAAEGLRWLLNRQRAELEPYHLDHAIEAIIAAADNRSPL